MHGSVNTCVHFSCDKIHNPSQTGCVRYTTHEVENELPKKALGQIETNRAIMVIVSLIPDGTILVRSIT